MTLDVELYRRTIYVLNRGTGKSTAGAQVDFRRISAIDIQPGGAMRTLVFLHGYGGSATQWLYQLRFFWSMARVIAPDLSGHGLSDDLQRPSYTMEGLVDDLEQALTQLAVEAPFYLVAHSFGGAIATEYALRHPEHIKGLVLIGVPTRFRIRPILRRLMDIPDPLFSWVARRIRVALFAPQRTLRGMHDRVMNVWHGGERMQQLRVPTLVVLGQRDTVFQKQAYEDVPRIIPGAHQTVIPVSAHLVQLERPDAVNRAIRRFIEGKQDNQARITRAARHAGMPWLQYYDSDVPHDLPVPGQSLQELLSNAARSMPERPALIFFGQKIGYRELDHLSNRFAHALQKLNVSAGERIAVLLPNIPQFVIAFYGILKAGCVVVLGSPLSNEEEIRYQLQRSDAHALVTLNSYRGMVERICVTTSIRQVIYTDVREYLPLRQRVLIASLIDETGNMIRPPALSTNPSPDRGVAAQIENGVSEQAHAMDDDKQEVGEAARRTPLPRSLSWAQHDFQPLLRSQSAAPLYNAADPQELALLQYTSGTTDVPRGVMLSHRNLLMNAVQTRHWVPDTRRGREVILCVLPLSHSYGVTGAMNMSMALVGTLVLLPTVRTHRVLEAIKAYRPSLLPGIPALYLAIANYPHVRSYKVSAIRFCISGSAPLPVEVQEAFEKLTRGHLVEGYGLTEASPATHSNPLKGERRVGSIGLPLPGTLAKVVDMKTGEALLPGQIGELLIQGPQVMQGYWDMPEETQEALKDGWLHTGDLASMDEDGFFTIVDRKKDLILAGAYNFYPRDVEEVLYEHPKVLEAAVVGIANPQSAGGSGAGGGGATTPSPFIKAVVVLKQGEKATADELLALCRERLDAYKVPRQIEFRSELPKNFVGKVLRRMLVEAR